MVTKYRNQIADNNNLNGSLSKSFYFEYYNGAKVKPLIPEWTRQTLKLGFEDYVEEGLPYWRQLVFFNRYKE
jgi:hypothetical protein